MKISAIEIRNFKRIDHIKIEPGADKAVLLIGGKNAQGKSSVLDALTAVFGGGKQTPADPIRHGTEEATISVRLDDGIEIDRIYQADGKSYVEVRSVEGAKFSSPQAMLDKLVGGRFLDPLAFTGLDAKKQRLTVLDLADKDRRIPKLDEKRKAAFDARTEANRAAKDNRAAAENLRTQLCDIEPAPPIDVAAEVITLGKFDAYAVELERHQTTVRITQEKAQQLGRFIDEVKAKLRDTEVQYATAQQAAVAAQDAANLVRPPEGDVAAIKARLQNADAHNQRVHAYHHAKKRFDETEAIAVTAAADAEKRTETIAEIDRRKAEILATAQLPAGLTVGDDGLLLNGINFDQASGAEQFGVALQLAIAANPKLSDVWIKDGALLDDDHIAALPALAASAGVRFWIERVGSRDIGAIIISDGTVVAGGAA